MEQIGLWLTTSTTSVQLLANSQTPTGEVDWDSLRITGTGTFLEKSYLRLTSIPDPSSVRSEAVLKKSVEFVKQKWKQGAPWNYVTDQFKSIRQDLTVQGIYNEFTVQVYETHARLCLENARLHLSSSWIHRHSI